MIVVAAVLVDAALVGLSRVVLNAHYPSDAIASYSGGLGVLGVYGFLTPDGGVTAGDRRDGASKRPTEAMGGTGRRDH